MSENLIENKSWKEFRSTGLVLFINSILHVFGWAIVFEMDDDSSEIKNVYPARVKFRGFDEKSTEESHIQIANYLKSNIEELHQEANS